MRLEVLVPYYNESPRLEGLVTGLARALRESGARGGAVRFWWADDGSTDGSGAQLRSLLLRHFEKGLADHRFIHRAENQGKGSVLRFALACVLREVPSENVVAFWDADGELDPRALFEAFQLIERGEADVVFGRRVPVPGARAPLSQAMRRAGNHLLTAISNACTGLGLSDVHCCMRAARAGLIAKLPLQSKGFDFEAEFVACLAARVSPRPRIAELAVGYRPRSGAEGKKIGIRDVPPQLRQALRGAWARLRPGK